MMAAAWRLMTITADLSAPMFNRVRMVLTQRNTAVKLFGAREACRPGEEDRQ